MYMLMYYLMVATHMASGNVGASLGASLDASLGASLGASLRALLGARGAGGQASWNVRIFLRGRREWKDFFSRPLVAGFGTQVVLGWWVWCVEVFCKYSFGNP